ncbi:Target of Myb protein 1 [Dissostichus eleginoides]|uniref:Target of Myb protein 1 n=1 Tax=Dissostichus eleginoides TaxID=100907 RepID=A0AAD9B6R5_DISEL|nr:Target of Myb protein 1 [Dissostichus eleginoides]
MEFLLGNPFSTPVGQRIESATNSSLPPKDAVRALKKRIMGNKNFKEVMLTLTVLETCVKNCGYRFHILVTTRDFVEGVLVRAIIPRNNPPLVVHDRVLSIVQAWADAFRSSPDLTGVVSVYEDLRRKGLEFPMTELDGYSPEQAPKKTAPENGAAVTTLLSSKPSLISPQCSELKLALEGNNALTPSQIKQLKVELGVVRTNLTTMSDMMSQLDPVTVKQADMELLERPPYANLTSDFDLTPESGVASVTNDSSFSLSKADSVSSQMARLSTSESDDALSPRINASTQQRPSDQSEVDGRINNAAAVRRDS